MHVEVLNVCLSLIGIFICFVTTFDQFGTIKADGHPCALRSYGKDALVCVCNATYCDTQEPLERLKKGYYVSYTSSQSGARFAKIVSSFHTHSVSDWDQYADNTFQINRTTVYQKIEGFGGAVSDAVGINIASLSDRAQEKLLQSYYSPHGIEHSLVRVTIGGTDFSTRKYTYADQPGDFSLTNFTLAPEDLQYKIPVLQRAQAMSQRPIKMYSSAWTAPAWMKTNNALAGRGSLIGQPGGKYFKTWANYLVKFLDEYAKHNLTFWGMTAQNEPADGLLPFFPFNCMGWTPTTQRDWIKMDLGPLLWARGFKDLKLIIMDDQRLLLPAWPLVVLADPETLKYVSGIAMHWYWDPVIPAEVLDFTYKKWEKDGIFLIASEACQGSEPWEQAVTLGSWPRGEKYAADIVSDLNHFTAGWTDWNIALDMEGGPNWASNFADSAIIVNGAKDEFYKQPMFYAIGHFSKFIPPGSYRVEVVEAGKTSGLQVVALHTPDGATVVVVVNSQNEEVNFRLFDRDVGYTQQTAPPHSIQTVVWWSNS